MAVLVLADHDDEKLSDATAKIVTAAIAFGGDLDILVSGGCAKSAGRRRRGLQKATR